MVPEAPLEQTDAGFVPAGEGWFVHNGRGARWRHREGRGQSLPFAGKTDFPQVGINLFVLGRGEPIGMYYWEADQEDFLALSGEALLIIEELPRISSDGGLKLALLGPQLRRDSGSSPRTSLMKRSASSRRMNVSTASPSGWSR